MGLNLHLDRLMQTATKKCDRTSEQLWLKVANMQNTRFAVDMASHKITSVITTDCAIRNAVDTLRQAQHIIREHGATEGLMQVFNAGDQLANAIGIEIPVINETNAKAVGAACVEGIEVTVDDAYAKVREFFDDMCVAAESFLDKLKDQAAEQSETISSLVSDVVDNISKINASEFASNTVFGYTQPVFMERVAACQFIVNNIAACGYSDDELRKFTPFMKTLGYKVVEQAVESVDGTITVFDVVPQTDAEKEEAAPDPKEVTNPPAEPAAEPEKKEAEPKGKGEEPPANQPQEQSMQVFRWTPGTIRIAALALKNMLASVPNMKGISAKLNTVRDQVVTSIEAISSVDGADKASHEKVIADGRAYAAFIGNVATIFGSASNELVDQMVAMTSKLVDAIPENEEEGTPVTTITPEQPLGEPSAVPAEPATPEEPPVEPTNPATVPAEPAVEPTQEPQEPAPVAEPAVPSPAPVPVTPPVPAQEPEAAPAEPQTDEVEKPENVPNTKPVTAPDGVCPEGEADPGKAPHKEETETPEGEQPSKKAETLLEDTLHTRLW